MLRTSWPSTPSSALPACSCWAECIATYVAWEQHVLSEAPNNDQMRLYKVYVTADTKSFLMHYKWCTCTNVDDDCCSNLELLLLLLCAHTQAPRRSVSGFGAAVGLSSLATKPVGLRWQSCWKERQHLPSNLPLRPSPREQRPTRTLAHTCMCLFRMFAFSLIRTYYRSSPPRRLRRKACKRTCLRCLASPTICDGMTFHAWAHPTSEIASHDP